MDGLAVAAACSVSRRGAAVLCAALLIVSVASRLTAQARAVTGVQAKAAPQGRPAPAWTERFRTVVAFGDSLTDTTAQGRLPARIAARFGISPMQWAVQQVLLNYTRPVLDLNLGQLISDSLGFSIS